MFNEVTFRALDWLLDEVQSRSPQNCCVQCLSCFSCSHRAETYQVITDDFVQCQLHAATPVSLIGFLSAVATSGPRFHFHG